MDKVNVHIKIKLHVNFVSTEITQTHSVGLPVSPSQSSSPGDHSSMPLSPRISLNFPLSSNQQRPHTPLQNSPNVLQATSPSPLKNAPLIRVLLPHGQHTLVSVCVCASGCVHAYMRARV